MPGLPVARPEAVGFDSTRLEQAFALLKKWAAEDRLLGAGLCVGRRGRMVEPRFAGRHQVEAGSAALKSDALFLVASITKPVTVTAALMLVERGELALEDRVARYVPAFAARGKGEVQVRHLMTHTSGLPDMLPDNDRLRKAHQPLSAFVKGVCGVGLSFAPGTRVSYQSMGTLMLAEIIHQVSGKTVHEFLRREVFEPLGMSDTSLGWQKEKRERIAQVRQAPELLKEDWTWNSPYWLGLGAPWGGMITSPADFARFRCNGECQVPS